MSVLPARGICTAPSRVFILPVNTKIFFSFRTNHFDSSAKTGRNASFLVMVSCKLVKSGVNRHDGPSDDWSIIRISNNLTFTDYGVVTLYLTTICTPSIAFDNSISIVNMLFSSIYVQCQSNSTFSLLLNVPKFLCISTFERKPWDDKFRPLLFS